MLLENRLLSGEAGLHLIYVNHMPVILTDVIPDQSRGPQARLILSSSEDGLFKRAKGDLDGEGEHGAA